MTDRFPGTQIRLAIIISVDHGSGIAQTRWLDDDERGPTIPVPHPFSGRGEGIYVGLRIGTIVALSRASYARYIPVSIVSQRGIFSSDITDVQEMQWDDVGVPSLEDGEVVIQGPTGSIFKLDSSGNLGLFNNLEEGWRLGGDQDEGHRCAIDRFPPVAYTISQAGFEACGIIRRDIRPNEESLDSATFDAMFDLEAEQLLEEVGRDPTQDVTHGTRIADPKTKDNITAALRNPPFVEKRNVMYEFGTGWNVGTFQEEEAMLREGILPVRIFSDRRERRSNILSLSLLYPNELMETVEGTLVDIFGNLLDINRNIILPPSGKDIHKRLENMFENARHTVVLHREINTRKGWSYTGSGIPDLIISPDASSSADNARNRSRWALDVDKEGLTKLNIPSTSETGNVPCLTRHETSSSIIVDGDGNPSINARTENDAKQLFRNDLTAGQQRRDVFLDQFGPGGIDLEHPVLQNGQIVNITPNNRLAGASTSFIDGQRKTLPNKIEAGTAFHDITQTAAKLLAKSINSSSYSIVDPNPPEPESDGAAVGNKIIQSFLSAPETPVQRDEAGRPTNYPNAGGRSLHANLDGSMELSIGANTIDRLSWIMDTAGGIVARIGRDRYGRSAVVQMDGSLAMEIGGYDFVGTSGDVDQRFSNRKIDLPKDINIYRAGKVVIRVRRANKAGTGPDTDNDNKDQVIIIDENGISLQATGQLSLSSTMDMVLQSKSHIIIDAPAVQVYKGNQQRIALRQGARKVF